MDEMIREKAFYIITYYSNLLTFPEKQALRHVRSTVKIDDVNDERRIKMYLKTGWLSDDPEILNYLKDGHDQFIINCANRILRDSPGEVFLNLCPVCNQLARTPEARQCRFCGYDWH